MKPARIDQILSRYGYCSRSEARAWLKEERVMLGGVAVKSPSDKAPPDKLLVDGELIEKPEGLLAMLHKPAGYVCSHDPREGPGVYELLPSQWIQRNPVVTTIGRLDKDATGLLLITDVGGLVHQWTSPKHKVPKLYEVTVDNDLPAGLTDLFARGTLLLEDEDKACLPAKLEIISPREARLEIIEGRYHQVKRMFASQGCTVTRLHRSRFGDLELGELEVGKWKFLELPSS